jgi:hypothetical protein
LKIGTKRIAILASGASKSKEFHLNNDRNINFEPPAPANNLCPLKRKKFIEIRVYFFNNTYTIQFLNMVNSK